VKREKLRAKPTDGFGVWPDGDNAKAVASAREGHSTDAVSTLRVYIVSAIGRLRFTQSQCTENEMPEEKIAAVHGSLGPTKSKPEGTTTVFRPVSIERRGDDGRFSSESAVVVATLDAGAEVPAEFRTSDYRFATSVTHPVYTDGHVCNAKQAASLTEIEKIRLQDEERRAVLTDPSKVGRTSKALETLREMASEGMLNSKAAQAAMVKMHPAQMQKLFDSGELSKAKK